MSCCRIPLTSWQSVLRTSEPLSVRLALGDRTMTETQLARFEVFLIEEEGKPAEHVGSVHAPDREMALLNARDVFVRRPRCRDLWVAPSARVLFRTAEEMEHAPAPAENRPPEAPEKLYLVFAKPNHREPLALSHCVPAQSPEDALVLAMTGHSTADFPFCAVVAQADVTRSEPGDVESFFKPAETKHYKRHSEYPIGRQMKEVRQK